jgi:peptidoglycan/LPS O-acetylase OafA/YrhL
MIQRIQSVWLLLAALCVFLTYQLPFYTGANPKAAGTVYELNGRENFGLILVTFITGALAAAVIFLFKNRTLQLRLCVLGILLEAILIFLYYREVQTFTSGTYALWAILHSVVVICFVMAARAINKDEKLIKESDRLR